MLYARPQKEIAKSFSKHQEIDMKKVLDSCNQISRDDKEMLRQLLIEKYEPLQNLLLQNKKNQNLMILQLELRKIVKRLKKLLEQKENQQYLKTTPQKIQVKVSHLPQTQQSTQSKFILPLQRNNTPNPQRMLDLSDVSMISDKKPSSKMSSISEKRWQPFYQQKTKSKSPLKIENTYQSRSKSPYISQKLQIKQPSQNKSLNISQNSQKNEKVLKISQRQNQNDANQFNKQNGLRNSQSQIELRTNKQINNQFQNTSFDQDQTKKQELKNIQMIYKDNLKINTNLEYQYEDTINNLKINDQDSSSQLFQFNNQQNQCSPYSPNFKIDTLQKNTKQIIENVHFSAFDQSESQNNMNQITQQNNQFVTQNLIYPQQFLTQYKYDEITDDVLSQDKQEQIQNENKLINEQILYHQENDFNKKKYEESQSNQSEKIFQKFDDNFLQFQDRIQNIKTSSSITSSKKIKTPSLNNQDLYYLQNLKNIQYTKQDIPRVSENTQKFVYSFKQSQMKQEFEESFYKQYQENTLVVPQQFSRQTSQESEEEQKQHIQENYFQNLFYCNQIEEKTQRSKEQFDMKKFTDSLYYQEQTLHQQKTINVDILQSEDTYQKYNNVPIQTQNEFIQIKQKIQQFNKLQNDVQELKESTKKKEFQLHQENIDHPEASDLHDQIMFSPTKFYQNQNIQQKNYLISKQNLNQIRDELQLNQNFPIQALVNYVFDNKYLINISSVYFCLKLEGFYLQIKQQNFELQDWVIPTELFQEIFQVSDLNQDGYLTAQDLQQSLEFFCEKQ